MTASASNITTFLFLQLYFSCLCAAKPHQFYISFYIRSLGLVLGLGDTRLRYLEQTSDNLLDDVISAWLRREEDVDRRGVPSWATLVKALRHRRLGQTGIAENITRDKNLPPI